MFSVEATLADGNWAELFRRQLNSIKR